MVRAYVETKNGAAARRQARECRRLVPRVEPSAFRHTPEVRDLLADVDAQMASEAPGTLEVQSEPSDCLVRINGVQFGRTPLSGVELPVGAYRMQVECEEAHRGRIHRIGIVSGNNMFTFDGSLEHAVRTRPVLRLEYDAMADRAERMDHARQVAAILGGAHVMVVSVSSSSVEPASVWLAVRHGVPEAEDMRRAVDALFEGRSVDFSGPQPIARDQRIAGWSLLGVGVASIGASIGLHVWRGELGDRFIETPANLSAAQQWNDVRIGVWTTAAFGGAATSAAMPLLLPDYERTPWWGWTVGAVGLGLAGYAIYEGVTMTGCTEPYIADQAAVRSCVARG